MVLDPALSLADHNHHNFLHREIAQASAELDLDCAVFGSAWNQPADCRGIVPFFESDTYYFFADVDDYRSRESEIRGKAARDYSRLDFTDGARVWLPTASPWQLEALAGALRRGPRVRLAVGMVLPARFWSADSALQRRLDEMTWDAVASLVGLDPFFYSETGHALDRGREVPLPTCIPMISDATLRLCEELSDADRQTDDELVTFGFFGGLFEHKGVSSILAAAKECRLDPRTRRISFVIPPEFHARASELEGTSESISVASSPLGNDEYLRRMSAVTAVLCCYDAAFYAHQMSGIVTEAAALGKPVIVSAGSSLHHFLLRHAPGTTVAVADVSDLAAALKRPSRYWRALARSAAATAPVVRELKRFKRFLQMAFSDDRS